MRSPDTELFGIGLLQEISFAAHRVAQNAVDQRTVSAIREFHRFVNGGVLRSLKQKQLIETKSEQVAGIVIEMTGAELAQPKVEQRNVTKNAVEKFGGKSAIRRVKPAGAQALAQDCVGEFSARAPLFQGGESDTA